MRVLDVAATGISRGVAALDGAAGRIASRSANTAAGDDGALVSDLVTLRTASFQVQANVVVARTAAETEKRLVDLFA